MGVPALFRWLSQKYPKIITSVIEEKAQEIDGQTIPVDISKPNPNGEETDNLYLDMNNIVHPCSHPEDRPPPASEEEMMLEVFKYTERIVNMVRPRKLLMLAVDGVAPRAKMNQQRSRRFRAAKEAKEKDEDKEELLKMLRQRNGGGIDEKSEHVANKKTWDSNAITPGTPFMNNLALSLRYWISYKLNTDPGWARLKVIISDASVPGEGEHKVMEFIRSQRASQEHDPNTRHVIYGLDADLIMLGLATHEPHFRILREDVFFQDAKPGTCRLCGQTGHKADQCRGEAKSKSGDFDEKGSVPVEKPYIWLHVSVLREYLAVELEIPGQPFKFDLERALDDWIFMCFFVGNDFLPHLPSLEIREQGIDTLIAIWRDNIPQMGGYLTKDGYVDLDKAQLILAGLAKQEDAIFRRRRQAEQRKEANAKRRKLDDSRRNGNHLDRNQSYDTSSDIPVSRWNVTQDVIPISRLGTGVQGTNAITHDMVVQRDMLNANEANKSAAAVLKQRLLNQNITDSKPMPLIVPSKDSKNDSFPEFQPAVTSEKRKIDAIEPSNSVEKSRESTQSQDRSGQNGDNDDVPDTVRLWEDGYADRYYEQKFQVSPSDIDFRHKVAQAYVQGLAWVLLYYFQGCPSWTWFYPYHYAPFAADFVGIASTSLAFEKGSPSTPYEQLMAVLPAASNHNIPEVFHPLMTDEDSPILDFYPEDFIVDLNGKKFAWQGVALLPFINRQRLLAAMAEKVPLLSPDQVKRNEEGSDMLYFSDHHPLYEDVASHFYSKRQGSPKHKLNQFISDGLAGRVKQDPDYLPQSALHFPLNGDSFPDLEENHSISVKYEIPKSAHIHKSMLLRGVKFSPPALDQADIAATRGRARGSGRSHGGAPLHNGYDSRNGRPNSAHFDRDRINYSNSRPNPFAAHLGPHMLAAGAPGYSQGPSAWHQHGTSSGFHTGQAPPPGVPHIPFHANTVGNGHFENAHNQNAKSFQMGAQRSYRNGYGRGGYSQQGRPYSNINYHDSGQGDFHSARRGNRDNSQQDSGARYGNGREY